MTYLVMAIKSAAWLFAFWFGIGRGLRGMLLISGGITLFLTAMDRLLMPPQAGYAAFFLTIALYFMMSFFLLPLAWKLRHPAVSMACNVMGSLGALAMVNFTIDYGLLPFLNQ